MNHNQEAIPTQSALPVDNMRRIFAGAVYQLLRVAREVTVDLHYDDNYTVTAGPIRVHFATRAVEISFPDPYGDPNDDTPVVLHISGPYTFGAIQTLVEGLLGQLAVTP